MAFPEADRVIYEKNPIEEVVCQLRFPAVLKIETEPPAEFQEGIRSDYPFYASKPSVKLPAALPPEMAALLGTDIPSGFGRTVHEFGSRDAKWTLCLARDFLAVRCLSYDRWENFVAHLRRPLEALREVYRPAFFSRLGLRYRDVIRRSILGLERAPWAELLQPAVAGALACSEIAADIEHAAQELLMRLPDSRSQVHVHHGLTVDPRTQEPCYVIDADFFNQQQSELSDALERLNFLNHQSRLFFRWCIRDRLHQAMRPRPVPQS
jgi:uncharacterized protein (TIGR04255 family)